MANQRTMDCFPLDEEIEASIPFSNNSVVLAANSVLQQLLTLADERNLQSVDVLLTSIWLLLRETKLGSEEKDSTCDGEAITEPAQSTDTSCRDSFRRTNQFHTKTGSCALDSKGLENRKNDNDKATNEIQNTVSPGNDAKHQITCCESTGTRVKEIDTPNEAPEVRSNLIVTDTSNLHVYEMVRSQREIIHTQTDAVQVTDDQTESTVENEKLSNKHVRVTSGLNCISKDTVISDENNADIENTKTNTENLKHNENETKSPPPVLCPQDIHQETCGDSLDSEVADVCSLPKKSADIPQINGGMVTPDVLNLESQVLSELEDSTQQETEPILNSVKESDTILKTSDGKTFQISSDDGLTFEDSFVIEKVDSDDSDDEMDMNYIEESESCQNSIDEKHCEVVAPSMTENPLIVTDIHLTDLHIEKHIDENERDTKGSEKSYMNTDTSNGNTNELINSPPYIVSCTEVTEKPTNKADENVDAYMEGSGTIDKPENVNKNLGGIISSDNDSELKIINIAGGVTFYDDNEDNLANDRMSDYIETKPDTSSYNPFSYSGYTPAPSSCTSLYSDVVFSSHSGIPGTFMSADPRLAVQNYQQLFVPSNMNIGMGSDPTGRLYQPVLNTSQYESSEHDIPQGFQYFLPEANTTNLLQPLPVQIKSESKIMIPTKKRKSKKRKKSPEGLPMKDYYSIIDPVSGKLKEYYNVRDPVNGKFIRMDRAPYINNLQKFTRSSSNGSSKTSIKQELSGTPSDIVHVGQPLKQFMMMPNQHTSVGTSLSPGIVLENQSSSYYTVYPDAQPTTPCAEQCLGQVQDRRKQLDKKLKAIQEKKNVKPKKNMTEKEKKRLKTVETKRLNLLKKLYTEKKNLTKSEQAQTAQSKSSKVSDLEYVVRDKGTCVNSEGLSQEYTIVTIKGLLEKPPLLQKGASIDQGTFVKQEEMDDQTFQQQTNSKKKIPLKHSKGKRSLKKSLTNQETVRPVKVVTVCVPRLTKVKSTKQKATAKNVLNIKQAKTNMIQEVRGKNNQKSKQKVSHTSGNILLKSIEPQLTNTGANKAGKVSAGKNKAALSKGKQNRHEIKPRVNKKKANKRTTRAFEQPVKATKLEEEINLIMTHHGERGAKLAAQQRISAYNESD